MTYSNHDPIVLDLLNVATPRKQFRFHFENTWSEESTFRKEVADYWLELPATHILSKLMAVSSFMARWGRNFFHKFRDKTAIHKVALQLLVDRTDSNRLKEYYEEKNKLDELTLHEEVYWKQRAKTFWLAEGDANTKFFHATALTRKRNNHIPFLVTESEEKVDTHDSMCYIVKSYFLGVFTGGTNNTIVTMV